MELFDVSLEQLEILFLENIKNSTVSKNIYCDIIGTILV